MKSDSKTAPVLSLETGSWYRGFIQGKTRIALAWAFAAGLIFSARSFPTWPGVLICFLGACLRFSASGYLRKDSRPAVGGPYSFTRNPLYLGTYLMAAGVALSTASYWLLGLMSVAYVAVYHFIILDEEVKLAQIFGAPYEAYRRLVPRFFPRPWPARREALLEVNPTREHHAFSWALAMKNRAFEPFWSFLGLVGFTMAVAYFWSQVD